MTNSIVVADTGTRRSLLRTLRKFASQQPLGILSFLMIVALTIAAIFADSLAPYDPFALSYDAMLMSPSAEHPFGTDALGRDILSRVMYGGRTALTIGFFSSLIGCTIGALIGIASAYFGGRIDAIIQRLTEILLALPVIVLALVIVAVFGRAPVVGIDVNLILAITIPVVPNVVRVIRSSALSVEAMPYIEAARAIGYGHARIILRHIAPNVVASYLILFSAYIAQAILLEASLSFLGLGVTEPTPSWGLMLSGNASDFYREAPWVIIFPGLAVTLTVLAFSMFGDSLRDWFDPKLRVR
jgi:peptide/nickel transport system permease protein